MHFLLVNRFFGPDQSPTGRMLWDLGVYLTAQGHQVTVLTSNGTYAYRECRENNGRGFKIKHVRNVGRRRFLNWVWFWFRIMVGVPRSSWDKCIILTDPPFMALVAWLTRVLNRKSRPVYWWTMDLYPEALAAAGILRASNPVFQLLRLINELSLSSISGVISLGACQRFRLEQYKMWRHEEKFAITVPPWDHRTINRIYPNMNRFIERYDWIGRKIALYAGNLGEGHSFEEILDAARWLQAQQRADWIFVFAIRGTRKAILQAQSASLCNVCVMDYLPEVETSELLCSATVHLISMKEGWEGIIVPSKLYSSLQTTSPILFVGPSAADTAKELQYLHRGIALPPRTPGFKVAEALDELAKPSWLIEPHTDLSGPKRIAEFLTH